MVKIVVDAMGSDFAPMSEVKGSILALQDDADLQVLLVGYRKDIERYLDIENISNDISKRIEIVHTNEVVTMHDDPIVALKTKQDSSMIRGISLLKENLADGYVSAGNTGASLTIATIMLGRIDGVTRPTIGAFLPTQEVLPTLLIDVGATLECRSRFLYEYAIMGNIYYNAVMGIENPTIGLLNVGEESTKGTNEHIEAYKKLKNSDLNFYGNVEGGDILTHKVDIVIVDGFTGNALLKFAESMAVMMKNILDNFAQRNTECKEKIEQAKPIFKEILSGFNPEKTGGVPLLGINGTLIIGHGSSTPLAIKNMIYAAKKTIDKNVWKEIKLKINN